MESKYRIINAALIVTICLTILTAYGLGFASGAKEPPGHGSPKIEKELLGYIGPGHSTYWCEIWDDGRITLHTTQEYVESDGDDLVIRGIRRLE